MTDVAEEEARRRAMDDQADVSIDPNRPEIRVSAPIEPVEMHPRIGGVELKVKRGRLNRPLLPAGQPGETVGKSIGDTEVHGVVVRRSVTDCFRGCRCQIGIRKIV